MTNEEIEILLQRYALRAPGEGVKSRVLAAAVRPRAVSLGMLDYRLLMTAAAFVLAAVLTEPEIRIMPTSAADVAWRADVETAAAAIGGDDRAVKLVELLLPRPEPLRLVLEEEPWQ